MDECGLPVKLLLTPGQASDKAAAPAMLERLPTARTFVGDRGYDWQALVDLVKSKGGCAHIPTPRDRKTQRSVNHGLYRKRNLVERFFNKLKHFRRIATRFRQVGQEFPCRRHARLKPEMLVRRCLHSLGFRFRLHRRDLPGNRSLCPTRWWLEAPAAGSSSFSRTLSWG
uniref:Transposase, IS4 n=1 Tax=Magnetospirillum gryphiswaldense TaxID=55518 RepID=A4U073_9PROT|nr:transposase, IS4 [Magnetospirillum gryphiswaldense MSR-1]